MASSPTIAKAKPRGGPLLKAGSGGGNNPATIRLKVVVRHLPSLMKEDEFRSAMAEYINEETVEWFSWIQGKIPEEHTKPSRDSRCAIKFKNPLQIAALNEALRAHGPFTDNKGNTSNSQMEYSPFQKAPKKSGRVDARASTIEFDPDFISFVASLKAASTPAPAADGTTTDTTSTVPSGEGVTTSTAILANDPLSVPLPSGEKVDKPKTTPLIEYIRSHKNSSSDKPIPGKASLKSERQSKESSSARREKRRLEKSRAKGREREPRINEEEEVAIKQGVRAIDTETSSILKRENSIGGPLSRQNTSNSTTLSRQNSAIAGNLSRQNSGTGSLSRQNSGQPGALARQGSSLAGNNSRAEKGSIQEKEKVRERRRDAGGAASVVAILQRDLGITPSARRSRNLSKSSSTVETSLSTTNTVDSTPTATVTPPTPTDQEPQSPARPRRRRGGRGNSSRRLERDDSVVSNSSATGSAAPPPVAPVAILKKLPSNASTPSGPTPTPAPEPPLTPALLKREGSAARAAPPTGPAASIVGLDGVPTAPKSNRQHRRGSGPRGGAAVAATQAAMAMAGVPTAPAGDLQQKGRRNGGGGGRGGGGPGGGGFRGGRGRGGGGPPKRGSFSET